jgi:hypothetical protein
LALTLIGRNSLSYLICFSRSGGSRQESAADWLRIELKIDLIPVITVICE